MAKTAVINRNLKRQQTVKKFAKKRADLIATISNRSCRRRRAWTRGS